jgi:Tol biopolymer transport system component
MSLTAGTKLDHYEILSPLGAGGMGEVYRARDTKLGRDVAFKILPEVFAADTERLLRFQREAQLLASLNHPNIAQIYGIVESAQARAIVMELVEGETLQARLKRGAIPLAEALNICKQIAEALEAAHDRGIIHRDLKPGNIMIDADGRVKVLDFGLAKGMSGANASPAGRSNQGIEPSSSDANLSQSPTLISAVHTQANVLIGTAPYMSPEQVRGHAAGERSDVWAFGCVLYEMLTGKQAFTGETLTDLIGGIVRIDPDWTAFPPSVPPGVRTLVKRCLEKDRRRRYHAIGDVRIDLESAASVVASPPALTSRERMAWAVAAFLGLAAVAALVAGYFLRPKPAPGITSRFTIELPEGSTPAPGPVSPFPAISPDGRQIVYIAQSGKTFLLWLRPIGSLVSQPIPGTQGAFAFPFWSPDSRYIGFFAGGKLKKVPVAGGPPQILCDVSGGGIGTWNQEDVILFGVGNSIHRVAASGGPSTPVREPNKAVAGVAMPSFLPDGHHFLYLGAGVDTQRSSIEARIGSLESGDDKPLFPVVSRVLYADPGYLLFVKDGTLMARPFNAKSLTLTGEMFPIAEKLGYNPSSGIAAFAVSQNGTLIYRATNAAAVTELTWFDRSGKKLGTVPVAGNFQRPSLSPDEKHLVVEKREASAQPDIWLIDLARGTNSRFTFDPADDTYPIFSPDGQQVAFTSNRGGKLGLYVKSASGVGSEQLILPISSPDGAVTDWSRDGKILMYGFVVPNAGYDSWMLPMTGDRKPSPLLTEKFNDYRVRLSPDGKWISYTSDETGRSEIYVQTFPPSGGKWQVSVAGGNYSHWKADGKEIIFDSDNRKMMAVDVKLGKTFEAGVPHALFDLSGAIPGGRFVVTADAQRFLLPLSPALDERPAITAVLNWAAEIKK